MAAMQKLYNLVDFQVFIKTFDFFFYFTLLSAYLTYLKMHFIHSDKTRKSRFGDYLYYY